MPGPLSSSPLGSFPIRGDLHASPSSRAPLTGGIRLGGQETDRCPTVGRHQLWEVTAEHLWRFRSTQREAHNPRGWGCVQRPEAGTLVLVRVLQAPYSVSSSLSQSPSAHTVSCLQSTLTGSKHHISSRPISHPGPRLVARPLSVSVSLTACLHERRVSFPVSAVKAQLPGLKVQNSSPLPRPSIKSASKSRGPFRDILHVFTPFPRNLALGSLSTQCLTQPVTSDAPSGTSLQESAQGPGVGARRSSAGPGGRQKFPVKTTAARFHRASGEMGPWDAPAPAARTASGTAKPPSQSRAFDGRSSHSIFTFDSVECCKLFVILSQHWRHSGPTLASLLAFAHWLLFCSPGLSRSALDLHVSI